MWNYNIKSGSIWTLKSLNEFNENYMGMRFGEQTILILSTYIDENNIEKFTYLTLDRNIRYNTSLYKIVQINNMEYYINYDNVYTGDRRSLNSFISNINEIDIKEVLSMLGLHFNFGKKKKEQQVKTDIQFTHTPEFTTIHKYGMDVEFIPSKDVYLADNGRLILSDKIKRDILNDVNVDSIAVKYQLFPQQAIRIIKSKLKYQIKHK